VQPEKKPPPAAAGSEETAPAAADGEAWRTADPYAFLPKPDQNVMAHTTVLFSDGR
jgi:hypothetical protein